MIELKKGQLEFRDHIIANTYMIALRNLICGNSKHLRFLKLLTVSKNSDQISRWGVAALVLPLPPASLAFQQGTETYVHPVHCICPSSSLPLITSLLQMMCHNTFQCNIMTVLRSVSYKQAQSKRNEPTFSKPKNKRFLNDHSTKYKVGLPSKLEVVQSSDRRRCCGQKTCHASKIIEKPWLISSMPENQVCESLPLQAEAIQY